MGDRSGDSSGAAANPAAAAAAHSPRVDPEHPVATQREIRSWYGEFVAMPFQHTLLAVSMSKVLSWRVPSPTAATATFKCAVDVFPMLAAIDWSNSTYATVGIGGFLPLLLQVSCC